jgi:hypothetical protein
VGGSIGKQIANTRGQIWIITTGLADAFSRAGITAG